MTESALVLFSGGQDSTVCLAWALDRFPHVETIGFDYGQRHSVELKCRQDILPLIADMWPEHLVADHVLDLGVLGKISETALTRDTEIRFQDGGLPTTFVPGRNLLFFTVAAAVAYRRGHKHLVGGMCETDYSGYPDCRNDTLRSLQTTLGLGLGRALAIHAPLMWLTKAATWEMAEELGGPDLVELIRRKTHTCYLGVRDTLHPWGYGCGNCPACGLRRQGYNEYFT